jgi:outer membrane protein TolC
MKAIALLILLMIPFLTQGSELDRLIEFAFRNNPKVKSYDNLKKSFEYRSKFSLSLPNPSLSFSLNNVETTKFLPRRENPMSGFVLFLSQRYILPAKRERSSLIFSERAEEIDFSKESYLKSLERDIKVLYWDFSYSFEMERILRDIEREIKSLIEITEEKYRYGKALLSDLILLRVELLKVQEKLAQARRIRETTLSRLYSLAGGRLKLEGSPLEALQFPEDFDPEKNVTVRLFRKQLSVIKRELERAKVEHYPDFLLSAGYMLRPDIPDLFTVRLGLTLPVWYGKRERMLVLEKKEKYTSKLFEIADVKLKVQGDFEALRSEYRINMEILQTIEKEIKEKKKEISALMIAYEYDRTDIREILRAYRILWGLEFEKARLLKVLNQTVAKAEALQ